MPGRNRVQPPLLLPAHPLKPAAHLPEHAPYPAQQPCNIFSGPALCKFPSQPSRTLAPPSEAACCFQDSPQWHYAMRHPALPGDLREPLPPRSFRSLRKAGSEGYSGRFPVLSDKLCFQPLTGQSPPEPSSVLCSFPGSGCGHPASGSPPLSASEADLPSGVLRLPH